jgi:hypothetical protein
MRPRHLAILPLLLMVATACDRTPVGPLDDSDTAAIPVSDGESAAPLTLSGLLNSAIREVHGAHGVEAAGDLVRDLADIQRRLDGAAVPDRPALRGELRAEQLRIVLLVHGGDIVATTIRGVSDEAAALQRRRDALVASGIAAPEIGASLEDVPTLLALARNAATDVEALDAATRAAARTQRLRRVVAGAARLPSLADLFDEAATRLAAGGMNGLVAESNALRTVAANAVQSGDREHAHAATKAAREAQIRIVLAGLGPDAVADAIGAARDGVREQQSRLALAAAARDVSRLERMNESADDMLQRAVLQLRTANSAAALDLTAHAIDLLNAIDAAITSH